MLLRDRFSAIGKVIQEEGGLHAIEAASLSFICVLRHDVSDSVRVHNANVKA